jgi:alkanesulfonate monooxygenase SsuD/methylene tetrahydromethanopterin reductase-like flavin-dependent oxidoreductase (luciferase family)
MNYGFTLPYSVARQVADTACAAEKAGWDGLFVGDAIWCSDPMIALAAAAMVTSRIRLGTMILPAPIRSPQKVASESLSLDHLSNGRLTLGLGMGATWMGWQSFPDEVTDTKARAEMLGEMIDLLTLFYQCKQFDYDGKHYHLKLTRMEEIHYPPKPVQQPRIPLWVVGVWPRKTSLARAMKGDGLIPHKLNAEGKFEDVKPADLREMVAYVRDHRALEGPYDYIIEGQTRDFGPAQAEDTLAAWQSAGATWWIESMYGLTYEQILARIEQGPPRVG